MITITTKSVYGRSDWYTASAVVNGYHYSSAEMSRVAAFMAIVRQLAVKGNNGIKLT